MNSFNTFASQSLKHFIKIGAILPSSNRLAKRMVKDVKKPIVLELGPGTGVFTKKILKKLPKEGRLISIEDNEVFVKYLKNQIKDKRFKIIMGDALKLKEILNKNGIKKVGCIISGLPLGHFKRELKQKILKEIAECLENDGIFIQFEYLLAGMKAVKKFFPYISISCEILNLPPAFVMKCKKEK